MDDLVLRELLREVEADAAVVRKILRELLREPVVLDDWELGLWLIAVYLKRLLGRDG